MSKDKFRASLRERYSFVITDEGMLDTITDYLMAKLQDGTADLNGGGIKNTCYCCQIEPTYSEIYRYWRDEPKHESWDGWMD